MANPEHLKILSQGAVAWNKWRKENPQIIPKLIEEDLYEVDLLGFNFSKMKLKGFEFTKKDLRETNFRGADLCDTDFSRSNLFGADFRYANIQRANFWKATLSTANFSDANLSHASFVLANLNAANLKRSNLSKVILSCATLVHTDLSNAILVDANVYGASIWDIKKKGLVQKNLMITPPNNQYEPWVTEITVDDLEVAQFIYLLLNNQKIRDVIETITSKAVLILGRFTPERKALLDAIKDELRFRNYLPIVFDFENTSNKSIDETVNLLARMSRFIIADITDAKSIPQELRGIVPDNPSVPVIPLIWKMQKEYAMFDHFRPYPWVLPLHEYESPAQLLKNIIPVIIQPAEQKVLEVRRK